MGNMGFVKADEGEGKVKGKMKRRRNTELRQTLKERKRRPPGAEFVLF